MPVSREFRLFVTRESLQRVMTVGKEKRLYYSHIHEHTTIVFIPHTTILFPRWY